VLSYVCRRYADFDAIAGAAAMIRRAAPFSLMPLRHDAAIATTLLIDAAASRYADYADDDAA